MIKSEKPGVHIARIEIFKYFLRQHNDWGLAFGPKVLIPYHRVDHIKEEGTISFTSSPSSAFQKCILVFPQKDKNQGGWGGSGKTYKFLQYYIVMEKLYDM